MAETTGSATGLEDLMSKFLTWVATVSGWTVDESIGTVSSGRQCAIHKGNLFVQFRWNTATPNTIAMYQSTGYTGGNRSGTHPGDSGNGYNTDTGTAESQLTGERCIELVGNTAMPNYWFYSDSGGNYLHVVVEIQTDEFRHFGCGNLEKFADWDTMTGGEYAYGQVGVALSGPVQTGSGILLDGGSSLTTTANAMQDRAATMRLAGAPGLAGSVVWANVWGTRTFTELTDTAGNARATCIGGTRSGPIAASLAWLPAGNTSGLAPTIPISVFYVDKAASPFHIYLLGFMRDVRSVHLRYFAPRDTFVLGADTWRVFPTVRRNEAAGAGNTAFQGYAYNTSA
jgi:hypothetical protein